jgi:Protein of unknown function (DUF2726)
MGGMRISGKHVDFVVAYASNSETLIAIELDDCSHASPSRMERDVLLDRACRTAGLPLLRVPASPSYDRIAIRELILTNMLRPRRQFLGKMHRLGYRKSTMIDAI